MPFNPFNPFSLPQAPTEFGHQMGTAAAHGVAGTSNVLDHSGSPASGGAPVDTGRLIAEGVLPPLRERVHIPDTTTPTQPVRRRPISNLGPK